MHGEDHPRRQKLGKLEKFRHRKGNLETLFALLSSPPPPEMTCGFLIQLVFCKKKMWFIGVEVEQETSAPPPKKITDPPLPSDLTTILHLSFSFER